MRLYRIARTNRARTSLDAFSGDGAAKFPGRWNRKGDRCVYCSDTLAGACLETLVHIRPLPREFPSSVYFEFELDEGLLEKAAALPKNWKDPVESNETREYGSEFLRSARAVGLLIPSVVIPVGWNVLLNPRHKEFKVAKVKGPIPFYYDPRLE